MGQRPCAPSGHRCTLMYIDTSSSNPCGTIIYVHLRAHWAEVSYDTRMYFMCSSCPIPIVIFHPHVPAPSPYSNSIVAIVPSCNVKYQGRIESHASSNGMVHWARVPRSVDPPRAVERYGSLTEWGCQAPCT